MVSIDIRNFFLLRFVFIIIVGLIVSKCAVLFSFFLWSLLR